MNTNSATYRILRRTLSELRVAIGASQLELFEITEQPTNDDAAALLTISAETPGPTDATHASQIPFAGYLLRVKSADPLAPDALREIRIHHRLTGILLRGIDAPPGDASPAGARNSGRMQAGFLTDTLLELLHLMDERAHKIANYVKIIELNDKILAANDLYDVLQLVMDLATDAIGGDDAALLLVDPRTGEMTFKVVAESYDETSATPTGPADDETSNSHKLEQIRIPAGQGIAGSVVLSARAEIIRDVSADPRSFQKVDRILGQTTRDMVVAPIVARGQVIGVIEVINSRARNGFLSEDLEMLQHIASHASLFIENMRGKEQLARVSQELDRKSHETTVLAELSALLRSGGGGSAPNADERAARFLRILGGGLRLHSAALLAVLPDQKSMREIARYSALDGSGPQTTAPGTTEPGWSEVSDLLLWILQNREPFRFSEPRRDPDARGSAPGIENRFRKANAAAMADPDRAPGIWLPVFSDDLRQIDLVISLTGLEHAPPPGATAGELAFFRTIMNLGRAIFTLDA